MKYLDSAAASKESNKEDDTSNNEGQTDRQTDRCNTLIAPQHPKKATKKMIQPTMMRKTGVLKKSSPRKSR